MRSQIELTEHYANPRIVIQVDVLPRNASRLSGRDGDIGSRLLGKNGRGMGKDQLRSRVVDIPAVHLGKSAIFTVAYQAVYIVNQPICGHSITPLGKSPQIPYVLVVCATIGIFRQVTLNQKRTPLIESRAHSIGSTRYGQSTIVGPFKTVVEFDGRIAV